LVQHVLEIGGEEALPIIIRRIRDGEEPELVVAEAAGYADFDSLMAGWRRWVAEQPLVSKRVAALPVVLDGDADEFASDPLLAIDGSKLRSARLGDLLRERDRPLAALVEYRKAGDGDGPASPMLMAREADCLAKLERLDEALALVNEGVQMYPEFTLLQVTRGRLLDGIGVPGSAVEAWLAAHDLNPFDVEVQQALVHDFGLLGKATAAAKHEEYLHILNTGGADRTAR
jgi:tetratricopeptide (TPR) repeat protein